MDVDSSLDDDKMEPGKDPKIEFSGKQDIYVDSDPFDAEIVVEVKVDSVTRGQLASVPLVEGLKLAAFSNTTVHYAT